MPTVYTSLSWFSTILCSQINAKQSLNSEKNWKMWNFKNVYILESLFVMRTDAQNRL